MDLLVPLLKKSFFLFLSPFFPLFLWPEQPSRPLFHFVSIHSTKPPSLLSPLPSLSLPPPRRRRAGACATPSLPAALGRPAPAPPSLPRNSSAPPAPPSFPRGGRLALLSSGVRTSSPFPAAWMGAAARRLRALGTAARRRQPGLRMVARRRPCALGRRRGGDRTSCGRRRGSGCASWGRRRGGGRTGWRRRRGKAACAARGWRRRRRGMAGGGIGRTAAARRAGVLIGPARHGKWAFVPCPGPDLRHVGRPGTSRIIKRANRAGPNRAGPKSGPGRAVPGRPIGQL